MTAEMELRVHELTRKLTEAHEVIDALLADRVDAVVDVETKTPLLLARAQGALRRERDQAARYLDTPDVVLLTVNSEGRITLANRYACSLLGWSRKELIGRDWVDTCVPVRLRSAARAQLRDWADRGVPRNEALIVTRSGDERLIEWRNTALRDDAGRVVGVFRAGTDITERKRDESERQSLTDRLSLATAVARLGVFEWDLIDNSMIWDATMFDIYGLPPVVHLPYARWAEAVHPDDLPAIEEGLHRLIDGKERGASEFRIRRPDGSVRYIAAAAQVVLDEGGDVRRLIGVNMDHTEQKTAEAELQRSRDEQIRFKDEFLSHVSHELRSPLTAIKQFTSILLSGVAGELNSEQRQYQKIVMRNIHQLHSMIDDLLEVTRLETGRLTVEPEGVRVSDAMTDAVDTLAETARKKGVRLWHDVPGDLPMVYADEDRTLQVLVILLDNAIKFTQPGGEVRITAGRAQQDDGHLLIQVSDTGCGIAPEIAGRIFERLYQEPRSQQSSRKGLGLGLYICRELVTRQGGELWFESEPGKGTTFSFTLPVFSVARLIAPLRRNGAWPAESVALLMVDFVSGGPGADRPRPAWTQHVRAAIQRCMLPDLDVLVPAGSTDPGRARFFVVVFADEQGVAVLERRISKHFDRDPLLLETGRTVSMSSVMLPFDGGEVCAATDNVAELARLIQTTMESQNRQRGLEA